MSELKQNAKKIFRLGEKTIESLLSLLPDQVKEISTILDINVGSQLDYNTVMKQANQKLIEDNISYLELTWKLQNSFKQRDEYAAKLEAELGIAREIQKKLQPDIDQIHQVVAFNIPAFHLSGDFYDYFLKPNGTICFCLGDVSGKGTSAALLMAKTISLFRCLSKVVDDISQIVCLMNNELCETSTRGMFVTFVGGWLDPGSRKMKLINAGHLPPLLINDKKVAKIHSSAPPLGVIPDVVHSTKNFSLANSRLYLYTDGFTEGRIKKGTSREIGKELGLDGFLRWLIQSKRMQI
ncbi:MAG: serine/threonine-protein phosphatase, partial [Desulfobacteraceae bacterium]|nr:serine/threonine-protein phosphatase [Desulfobacteraceae bacterium]